MNGSENELLAIMVGGICLVALTIYYFLQGGSNSNCYNCDIKLKFGERKCYSVNDVYGVRQNICELCYKKLKKKPRKGKYW